VEVFSFGNGDFLFQIFTAVKGVLGDGSFQTLIRITVLFGFLIVMYQLFFSMNITTISLGVLKQYLVVAIIYYALFVPKADVVIRDEVHNTNVSVTQVPLGVSLFAHFFTTAEKGITKIMETYFTTPNDMKFSSSGYAFSVMALDNMKTATPVDPYFKRTLNDYVVNCFFHDVLWGDKDLNTIIYSNTLLSDISPSHSAPLYSKVYNSTYPQGQAVTCSTAYSTVTGHIGTAAADSLDKLNQTMQIDVTAKLPVVVQAYLNVSQNATDLLGQSFVANAMKTGLAETAMYTGISADAVAYASALAEQQQRSSWTVAGELSKKYIPIMRQVLEAFVYGLFPLMFIFMMSPIATRMLHMYFILLMWLLMWSPLFAIVNLIVNVRTTGVLSSSYGYYSLGTMPYIYESTNDITAMAGYLAWMVPTLAFAIAKGSDYAMVSLASGIQGSTNLTTHHSGQAITGVDGAGKSAAAAGHFAAAQAFGSRTIADGMAAGNFFSLNYGMGMNQLGMSGMAKIGQLEPDVRGANASGTEQGAGSMGKSVHGATELVSKINASVGVGGARAKEEAAAAFGFANPGKMEEAVGEVEQKLRAGRGTSMGQYAAELMDKYGISESQAYSLVKAVDLQNNRAAATAFGGDAKAYGEYMMRSHQIGQGEQQAVIAAAAAAGLDLRDYANQKALVSHMESVGVLDAVKAGKVSMDDVRTMGKLGLMDKAGWSDAVQSIQSTTGMNAREASSYIKTGEGLNKVADIKVGMEMAQAIGNMKDKNDMTGYSQFLEQTKGSGSLTLSTSQAQHLNQAMKDRGIGNTNFKQGDVVRYGYDAAAGKITMAYGQSGAQRQTFDYSQSTTGYRNTDEALNVVDKGRRETIGTQSWHGSRIQTESTNTWDIKQGPSSPEAMWNAALTGSSFPVERISNSPTRAEKLKEETTQADQLAQALSSRISSSGREVSFTSAEGRGSITFKTPDPIGAAPVHASASGNVAIGRNNLEEHNYNIYQGAIRRFQDERNQNVASHGEEYANRIYTSRLHDLAKGTDEAMKGRTEFSFGASSVVGEPYERAKNMLNEIKIGDSKNSTNAISDKPLDMR